ncbi:MAG: hypothetical protein HZB26_22505 [Candidatus Hydrogenedentes bacterium]|nr:hypothetical protein [Candidatus Hydrogenedentota bacterium]
MYDPSNILTWLETHVQSMRQSRRKTLADVVSAALQMRGVGVLALGRAMAGAVAAKHCIKRVWRLLRNDQFETSAISAALFSFFRPTTGHTIVLADWTDMAPFQQLVFSLPRDGRALPFLCVTIRKSEHQGDQEGAMIAGEHRALEMLAEMCPVGVTPVIVSDRGFGNVRWLSDIANRGWYFVQRLSHIHQVAVEKHMGSLKELGIRRGWTPRDWGWGTMDEQQWAPFEW